MSSIKLKHASGNAVSIAAPESNPASDRTLYVPSNANGTILTNTTPGCILQVVQHHKSDTASTSSTSFVDTGISAAITPSSTSSKILVTYDVYISHTQSEVSFVNLLRGSTNIAQPSGSANYPATTLQYIGALVMGQHSMAYLDSPSTTSATTYKLQYRTDANTAYLNRYTGNDNYHGVSHLTLMEVAA